MSDVPLTGCQRSLKRSKDDLLSHFGARVLPNNSHILNAASNLLGIALIIITGISVTGQLQRSMADEIAWAAALCFSLSCLLSYLSMRSEERTVRYELWADRFFLAGLFTVFAAVAILASYER